MEVTSTQKVLLATFKLEGNVKLWWRIVQRAYMSKNERKPTRKKKPIRWAEFHQVFQQQYVSEAFKDQKQVEFDLLEYGNMLVREYEHKFSSLFRYAPHYDG